MSTVENPVMIENPITMSSPPRTINIGGEVTTLAATANTVSDVLTPIFTEQSRVGLSDEKRVEMMMKATKQILPKSSLLDDVSPLVNFMEAMLPWLVVGFHLFPLLLPCMSDLVSTLWTFVLGLEREMTVGESIYLHLLICMLLYFCTDFVCEPRRDKTPDKDPVVYSPLAPNWHYPTFLYSWR